MKTSAKRTYRLGVLGSTGRMGALVIDQIRKHPRAKLVAQWNSGTPHATLKRESAQCDVVVDFSSPASLREFIKHASPRCRLISGTTGLDAKDLRTLKQRGKRAPTLHSPNFSIGVQWMVMCLRAMEPTWRDFGFQAELKDVHHKYKKDSPSGTALRLADASGFSPDQIVSIREGDVIGDHTWTLRDSLESLTVSHHAMDRAVFAHGAVQVAIWLAGSKIRLPRRLLDFDDYFNSLAQV